MCIRDRLCENKSSSIKLEVHNILQCHQRRTKPRQQRWTSVFEICGQTGGHKDMPIAILHTPTSASVTTTEFSSNEMQRQRVHTNTLIRNTSSKLVHKHTQFTAVTENIDYNDNVHENDYNHLFPRLIRPYSGIAPAWGYYFKLTNKPISRVNSTYNAHITDALITSLLQRDRNSIRTNVRFLECG